MLEICFKEYFNWRPLQWLLEWESQTHFKSLTADGEDGKKETHNVVSTNQNLFQELIDGN